MARIQWVIVATLVALNLSLDFQKAGEGNTAGGAASSTGAVAGQEPRGGLAARLSMAKREPTKTHNQRHFTLHGYVYSEI